MLLRVSVPSIRKNTMPALIAGAVIALAGVPAHAGSTWTALSGPSRSTTYGEKAEFTATVYGSVPGRMVKLKDGSTKIATGTLGAPLGVTGILSAGVQHTCAVTAAGAAECWGKNDYGRLGNGNTIDQPVPVQVSGLTSGVVAVAAAYYHSCALTKEGAVKCWGLNANGQLGNGLNTDSLTPVQVSGLTSGVVAIAAGGFAACALTDKGAVKCWGANGSGQLGNGNTTDQNTPAQVVGLTSGVAAITAGYRHFCALTDKGAAYCWGQNSYGALGNNTTTDSATPVPVRNMTSGVKSVAGGFGHSCAVTAGGAVKCWGFNSQGQLGNGSTTDSLIPVQVTNLASGVVAVDAGSHHSCALTGAGGVKCWGDSGGSDGRLGDGQNTDSLIPVQVTGLTSGVVSLTSLYWHSCAVTNTGASRCWGDNNFGQLGDGNTSTNSNVPVDVTGFGTRATLVPAMVQIRTTALSAGKRKLKAVYGGDANNAASTSDVLKHTVTKGKTKVKRITSLPRAPKAGKLARIKVQIKAKRPASGKPKGTLVLKDGRKKIGTFKVVRGKSSIRTRFATSGAHKLKAVYKGNGNWKGSTGKKTVRVRK